jgi:acyl carrier protein
MTDPADAISESISRFIVSARRLRDLDLDQNIFEQRLVSSMFLLQLIAFLEREYGFTVEDNDLDVKNFQNVRAMASFVRRKIARSQDAAKAERR